MNVVQIALSGQIARAGFSPAIRAVVTCSDRKKLPVPPELHLSALTQKGARARARAWIGRLEASKAPSLPARLLYAGDHWHVAQTFASAVEGSFELWVASAGYGLIPEDRSIKPYSASFSTGPDSVAREPPTGERGDILRDWWALLTQSGLQRDDAPRSLQALAARDPEAILIVALSKNYLIALRDDLTKAREELRGRGKLLLVSAGTKAFPELGENLLPVGAEVQAALGGSRLSLNVRIVRYLIQTRGDHDWTAEAATAPLRRLARANQCATHRTLLTDGEVIEFIGRARDGRGPLSRTALLRQLRLNGFACEQVRFRHLFARAETQ